MGTHTPENRIYILPETGCTLDYRTGYDMGKAEQQAKIDELVKALNAVEVIAAGEQHYNNKHGALIKIEKIARSALTRAKGE